MYSKVVKPVRKTSVNTATDTYATIDDDEIQTPFQMNQDSSSQLPSESSAVPATISVMPKFLQENPMYSTATVQNVVYDYIQVPQTDQIPYSDSADEPDFDQFSTSEAPPIPSFHGTPEPADGVYSEENINPSAFQNIEIEEDEEGSNYQFYYSVYSRPQPLPETEPLVVVEEKNIRLLKDLGMGRFGKVQLAHTVGLSLKQLQLSKSNENSHINLLVAVKRLKPDADESVQEAFKNDINFMARLNHKNVIRLLGVCYSEPSFIMMEYMEKGDLNHYLKCHEFSPGNSYPLPVGNVNTDVLAYMCLQIACGMKYLASLKFIHRDLATRNILVGQNFTVKIADFGMSQQLYSSFYFRIKGNAALPIRWMAKECFFGRFSEKTDVWAFGITMWEVFTMCQRQPYEFFTDQELIDDVTKQEDRTLLPQPENCPEEVYQIMLCCWARVPEDRAKFAEVYEKLLQIPAYGDA